MKTIFLFIPNYVYSSDFLRTHYIQYLTSKFRVVAFVPPALLEDGKPYFQSPNLIYIKWPALHTRFWNFFGKLLRYSLIRQYDFEPAIQRNLARNLADGLLDWRRRFLRAVSFLFPKSWLTPNLFTKLEVLFLPRSPLFADYVKQYRPAMVVTATPGFNQFDAEGLVLAKKFNIPTAAVAFSWDNLHHGGKNFRRPDYLIVWNEIVKNTAVTGYGYAPNRVFVSGPMRFDHYFKNQPGELSREDFLKSKNLDPKEKTILLTTVTKGNYTDEDLLLRNFLDLREKGAFRGYPNIFVRLHPKEEVQKFIHFMNSGIKNLRVEKAGYERATELGSRIELDEADLLNLKSTLKYADVEINHNSTITLEACAFNKPVINIAFPPKCLNDFNFTHFRMVVESGAVRLAKSMEEMINYINMYLENPAIDGDNRNRLVKNFIGFSDGLSYRRNVDFLEKILNPVRGKSPLATAATQLRASNGMNK